MPTPTLATDRPPHQLTTDPRTPDVTSGSGPKTDGPVVDIVNRGGVDPDKARLFPVDQTEASTPGEGKAPKPA